MYYYVKNHINSGGNFMKLIKKMIAASLALALVLSMSGCYWEGKTKYQSEKAILNELEERYGEEFFVRQMGLSSRTGRPVTAYCSPKDDKEIVFEVALYQFGESGKYYLEDTYIPMIVRREMKEKIDAVLAQYYEDFAVEVEIDNLVSGHESGITNADEASIITYSEAMTDDSVASIFIALNKEDFNDYSEIQDVLIECVQDFHLSKASIECYFADTSIIEKSNEILNNDNYNNLEIVTILSPGKCVSEKKYQLYVYFFNGQKSHLRFLRYIDESGTHIPENTNVISIER